MKSLNSHSALHRLPASNLGALTKCQGLSLIELMVGLGIGLFIITGVIAYLQTSLRSYHSSSLMMEVQDSGQAALEVLSEAHIRAGYLGLFAGAPETGPISEAEIDGLPTTAPTNCNTAALKESWVKNLAQPIFGLNNPTASSASSNCIPSTGFKRSDVATVRYVTDQVIADPSGSSQFFFRGSLRSAVIFRGSDVASVVLNEIPYSTHRIVAESYYVADGTGRCNGVAVPSLYRVEQAANGQTTTTEVVPRVEKFELQYRLDDLTFHDANSLTADDWRNISAIRIWVLTRSSCPTTGGFDSSWGTTSFSMGDQTFSESASGIEKLDAGYLREAFVTTVWIRNLSFQEEEE